MLNRSAEKTARNLLHRQSCSPLQAQKKETAPVREGNPSQTGAASPVVRYAILINAAARPGASAVLIFSAAATRWYG